MACVACPLCRNESAFTVNSLLSALVEFLGNPLRCPVCTFAASCSSEMRQHLMEHQSNTETPPTIGSSTVPSCLKDAKDATKCSKFQCKLCRVYQTDDLAAWKTHVESDHPDRKFNCPHCCKLFKGPFGCYLWYIQMSLFMNAAAEDQFCANHSDSV